jgi:hypothetical protein
MNRSRYHPNASWTRADEWRCEAALVTQEAVREFCPAEPEECERLVNHLPTTPVTRDGAIPNPNMWPMAPGIVTFGQIIYT